MAPFVKLGNNKYKGKSGKVFGLAQVRLWYAGGGKFPGQKGPGQFPTKKSKNPFGFKEHGTMKKSK